ncbi:hypothetical protein BC629DRAFT_1460035 [Irpex lacteus]|nr:hypothetical protein BC629DRAFT_1460035 [Irpex lacteus]
MTCFSSSCSRAVELAQSAYRSLWSVLILCCAAGLQDAKDKLPFIYDVILNIPYILSRTPEEHALKAQLCLEHCNTVIKRIRTTEGTIYEPYLDMPPVANGSVRVKFYPTLKFLYRDSVLSVGIHLCPAGALDLSVARRAWGLQNCYAVECIRLDLFQPANCADILSPMAVRLLTDGQYWLRVVEQPTLGRVCVRGMRRNIQRGTRLIKERIMNVWQSSYSHQLRGYISCSLFIGGCFATTHYMDLFGEQYEFYSEDACNILWVKLKTIVLWLL